VAFITSIWCGLPQTNPLVKLALLILSIVANSAGVERHFSKLGDIYSKKRSQIEPQRAHKTASVQQGLKKEFGVFYKRQKRHFGNDSAPTTTSDSPPVPSGSNDFDDFDDASDTEDIPSINPLLRTLEKAQREDPDLSDDDWNPPEVDAISTTVPAANRSIRLHWGVVELIDLKDVFRGDRFQSETPWGGSLFMFKAAGEENLATEMMRYELDDDRDDDSQPTGSENDPMVIDS
jgi:hypothetical protein